MDLAHLEAELDSLDLGRRQAALRALKSAVDNGAVKMPSLTNRVNLHYHTFFSFNFAGYSPSRVAWEARKAGLDAAGIVDFDVLDGMAEFLAACDLLELRGAVSMESRVYWPAYERLETTSPGEPGVTYFMGVGFVAPPPQGSEAEAVFADMRRRARQRNEAMLERLNQHLAPLRISYEKDVLPLTPSGNATERHMLAAMDVAAQRLFPDRRERARFWSRAAGVPEDEIARLLDDPARLRTLLRAKLMKKGGVGYMPPERGAFPPMAVMVKAILACQAIPSATWLDGTSDGEADPERLLDDYMAEGCLAINFIPDRNWNYADAEVRRVKVANLVKFMAAVRKRHLLVLVGTEMNNYGQKFVDDFDAEPLVPYRRDFCESAYAIYGHTILQQAAGLGRTSPWAKANFGEERQRANAFYAEVGRLAFPPLSARQRLAALGSDVSPADVLAILRKSGASC
ncbi:MAG: hypothetical protein N3A66_02825 [Planctomycetota bacterium]|nr:hypothetical protein [Planctomycetota bacterium]